MDIHIKVSIDDRIVSAARFVSSKITARRAGVAFGLCALSAAIVVAAPVERPHEFAAGDAIKASEINESFDVIYDELNARVIRADKTYEVEDCDALQTRLASLEDRHIASNATVTLELPAGTFTCAATIRIDHPDGHHIEILGAGSDETTLSFDSKDGFSIPMSRAVGLIDKLTIEGTGFTGYGVNVYGSASARLGNDVIVRELKTGVYVEGGFVFAADVISEDNYEHGFVAVSGGVIVATGATARDNEVGFVADLGSAIYAEGAHAENNTRFGFNANHGSTIVAADGVASGSQHGFDANAGSTISADGSTSSGNSIFGFAAWNNSTIVTRDVTSTDNTVAGFTARFGSFVHVFDPMGNSVTYELPGVGMFDETEASLVMSGD